MRHRYIPALVVTLVVVLLAGVALFAATTRPAAVGDTAEEVATVDGDPAAGATAFVEATQPACADCHALADAASTADVGPDLDDVAPGEDRVVEVLTAPVVADHEQEGIRLDLSPRRVADLAAYVSGAATAP